MRQAHEIIEFHIVDGLLGVVAQQQEGARSEPGRTRRKGRTSPLRRLRTLVHAFRGTRIARFRRARRFRCIAIGMLPQRISARIDAAERQVSAHLEEHALVGQTLRAQPCPHARHALDTRDAHVFQFGPVRPKLPRCMRKVIPRFLVHAGGGRGRGEEELVDVAGERDAAPALEVDFKLPRPGIAHHRTHVAREHPTHLGDRLGPDEPDVALGTIYDIAHMVERAAELGGALGAHARCQAHELD